MRKIPTLFHREFGPDVDCPATDNVRQYCKWVLDGAGSAYRKYDGQCVALFDGELYKRRTLRPPSQSEQVTISDYDCPEGWFPAQRYPRKNGKWPGWVPVDTDEPQNTHIVEAYHSSENAGIGADIRPSENGTFEVIGPKIQGNAEGADKKQLVRHVSSETLLDYAREKLTSYGQIKSFLATHAIEGLVFHGPGGMAAKIKRTDFGFEWPVD